ncbi:hypothetical protein CPC08DRAFT_338143 [Agrocybe pediades]|nr:hypothetical protein CPC08DRAFT_338143 [Agrocybe pediades]
MIERGAICFREASSLFVCPIYFSLAHIFSSLIALSTINSGRKRIPYGYFPPCQNGLQVCEPHDIRTRGRPPRCYHLPISPSKFDDTILGPKLAVRVRLPVWINTPTAQLKWMNHHL